MAQCVTCGSELHPDRAKKYNYCMKPECQEKNLKGLTMVAVGVNKSAEQYLLLDEQTKDELASGKFADQRRGSFGTSVPTSPGGTAAPRPARPQPAQNKQAQNKQAQNKQAQNKQAQNKQTPRLPAQAKHAPRRPAQARPAPKPWTKSQERLALLYNEQGRRPDEIAAKLGLSTYTVTQIILGSRNRGKL
jgi:DNA-binding CsgD family transcriptional regulator